MKVVASASVLRTPRPSSRRLDGIGVALAVLFALWVSLSAQGGHGHPGPVLLLLFGLVISTAVGRVLSRRPGLVSRLVALGVVGALVLTWPGVLAAGGAPLGYANGNATLSALGLIAALGAARAELEVATRRSWIGLAALLGALTVATGSVAGVLALAAALALLGLSAVTRWAGFAVAGGLVAVSLTVGVTTAVALGSDVGGIGGRVDVRGELWAAAADFARDEPVTGIGPGQFAAQNPVSADADLRWVHNEYLQVAAELGLVGLALLAGLVGWAWATLWTTARDQPATAAVAAAAVTVVGLHAAVDHVWHLPPVVLTGSLLLGAGTGMSARGRLPTRGSGAVDMAAKDHGFP